MIQSGNSISSTYRGDVLGRSVISIPLIPNGTPSQTKGSIGLDKLNKVYVRGIDGSIIPLSGSSTPTFTQLTVNGPTTINGSTTFNGQVQMPGVGADTGTTNLFNVTYGNGPPTSTLGDGVIPGSLYFDDVGNALYIFDGANWIEIPTATASGWAASLALDPTSGATDPVISAGQQIQYIQGIRIGGTNAPTGTVTITGLGIGSGATSTGSNSIAIGQGSSASGNWGVAHGTNATASGQESAAMGRFSTASGLDSNAIGHSATASGVDSNAFGHSATASAQDSTAIGRLASATAQDATALGRGATATHIGSAAIGSGAITTENYQVTLGVAGGPYVVKVPNFIETAFTEGFSATGANTAIPSSSSSTVQFDSVSWQYYRNGAALFAAGGDNCTVRYDATYLITVSLFLSLDFLTITPNEGYATFSLLYFNEVPNVIVVAKAHEYMNAITPTGYINMSAIVRTASSGSLPQFKVFGQTGAFNTDMNVGTSSYWNVVRLA